MFEIGWFACWFVDIVFWFLLAGLKWTAKTGSFHSVSLCARAAILSCLCAFADLPVQVHVHTLNIFWMGVDAVLSRQHVEIW